MAQRVQVTLVDDIDGSDADETLQFGIDGYQYEIDLNDIHAKELREALTRFVEAGRRVGGRTKSRKKRQVESDTDPAAIRAWARENGHEVTERGRIPATVRDAYYAATGVTA